MVLLSTLLISMFITMALIPILRTAAVRRRTGLDEPEPRKVHLRPVPKVGGLAIAAGALIPVVFVVDGGRLINSVLVGALILVVFGLADDIRTLSWKAKFCGQIVAALAVVLYGRLTIRLLGTFLPEGAQLPDALAVPLTVLVIVGVTNAINLSDGLDGLAGGTSLLVFGCIGLLAFSGADFPDQGLVLILCASVAGAIIGFLRFNTFPATVFMGDTGSQLLGFLAITLALGVTQRGSLFSPLLPLLLLGFPVLDTLTVMVERISTGRSPFHPDKNHFHHKLLRLGLFHTESVVAIYGITAVLTTAAYLLRYSSDWLLMALYAGFSLSILAAFAAAEHRGFRFDREGFFDIEVKGRLKILKEKNLLMRGCFPPVEWGVSLTFIAAALVPASVPGYFAALCAGFAAAILFCRFGRRDLVEPALRMAFYLTVPLVLYMGRAEPAAGISAPMKVAFNLAFGVLATFTVLTLKFTRRKKGFKATPMDFLILVIALVVPHLPVPALAGIHMGELSAKIIVLFFGFEVLLGELRGGTGRLTVGVVAGLVALALRGLP
jgi:UDP-GlcNAc:undecaprenyl-phosphate GlcNAc-1-phosphate transferase